MYCRLCDIEYPKSMRFCKWCGGGLATRETIGVQHCPACGKPGDREQVTCGACGIEMATLGAQPHDISCPSCSAPVRKGWMFCRQCGEQIATERATRRCDGCGAGVRSRWYYCRQCGTSLKPVEQRPAREEFRTVAGIPALPPESGAPAPFSNLHSGELPRVDDVIARDRQRAAAAPVEEPAPPPTGGTNPFSTSRSTGQLEDGALQREAHRPPTPIPASSGRLEASELIPGPAAMDSTQAFSSPAHGGPPPAPVPPAAPPAAPPQHRAGVAPPAGTPQPAPPMDATLAFTMPGEGRTDPELYRPTLEGPGPLNRPPTVDLPHGTPANAVYPSPGAYPGAQPAPQGVATVPAGGSGFALKWAALVVGLLVILGVGAAVALYALRKPATVTTDAPPVVAPTVPATPATPAPSAPPAAPQPPEGMVFVAGGTIMLGTDDASADAYSRPAHPVEVKPFFIDRTEVTNADYKAFVDATGHAPPKQGWVDGAPASGTELLPVTFVTWTDAQEYAKWAGKRLPTEAEWELAARGTDGRPYPWGTQWDVTKGNVGKTTAEGAVMPVGSFPGGASPSGALDLIGNVWEWTASDFSLYPGGDTSLQRYDKFKVIRGGAYDNKGENTAMYRGFYQMTTALPRVGFRCARDIS